MLIILFGFINNSTAQDVSTEQHSLMLTGKSTGESIKLRWAPTSMYAWKESNKVGYILERYSIRKGDQILSVEERSRSIKLSQQPIKPWTEGEQWRPLMERNDYAAIAAQALYGKSFSADVRGKSIFAEKDEQLNRFSFGLFAADQSLEVADALGLYFEDKSAVPGMYYLYKIYPDNPQGKMPIDTGFFYVGVDEVFALPKIAEVEVEFEDKVAYISWDKSRAEQFYSSYEVERSEDGEIFTKVNALPFVGMDKKADLEQRMLMMDSLEVNDKLYIYRVVGKTIFEEKGSPSDLVQGMGINPKVLPASIESISNQNNTTLGISWDFYPQNEKEITGFQLHRNSKDRGSFENISGEKLIDKTLRYFIDENPLPVNYYKIVAIDKYGRPVESFAALAQMEDSTPPAPPVNLRGSIMEDGTMVVTWSPNTEEDLMGYRVYFANREDRAEYAQITSEPVRENYFTYDVPMNTLSEAVFVKVRALDFRQNPSAFSKIVTIARPDSIPPAAPIFTNARPSGKGVSIIWENSASSDVVNMVLERKKKGEEIWENVKTMMYPKDINVKSHQDTMTARGVSYQYRLKAIDDAELVTYSRVISASKIDNGIRRPIEKINIEANRKTKMVALSWNYFPDGDDLTHYVIYRSAGKERPRKYSTIKKETVQQANQKWKYEDVKLKMDTIYKYQVRAIYRKGAQSPLSPIISIEY